MCIPATLVVPLPFGKQMNSAHFSRSSHGLPICIKNVVHAHSCFHLSTYCKLCRLISFSPKFHRTAVTGSCSFSFKVFTRWHIKNKVQHTTENALHVSKAESRRVETLPAGRKKNAIPEFFYMSLVFSY